jgi:protocatechuate 3,4-dioxygenase beta subunit
MPFYRFLTLLFFLAVFASCKAGTGSGTITGDSLTSFKMLTADNEPGEKIIVTGRVIDIETGKPVPGAVVYAYHTDKNGIYSDEGSRNPRIKGWLKTDTEGKFTIKSVIPGSYPDSRNPAHIHFEVEKEGYTKLYGELLFEGDPYITDEYRNAKGFVVGALKRDGDIASCEFDLMIEK